MTTTIEWNDRFDANRADTEQNIRDAVEDLDKIFGSAYVRKHPELIATFVQSRNYDARTLVLMRGLERIETALRGKGD